jgi:hypothetical protein
MKKTLTSLAVLSSLSLCSAVASAQVFGYDAVWDDFDRGFSVGAGGSHARWFYYGSGSYVANDGRVSTGWDGLRVAASGTNSGTGEPAFVRTTGQESTSGGISGLLDRDKWVAYMNHASWRGYPGFDALPGYELSCAVTLSGRTYGTAGQPFGPVVTDPNDDPRLASVAQSAMDFETGLAFHFVLTNARIYAVYERLPSQRATLGNYAAFTAIVPVATRANSSDVHQFRIGFDKSAGVVRWYLDGHQVYQVGSLGHRIDRAFLTLDHGGADVDVSPNQLDCGLGMYTQLDAYRPSDIGLVRLSEVDYFYFDPDLGEPNPEGFVDNQSLLSNRLFGQGASLTARQYSVALRSLRDAAQGGHDGHGGHGGGRGGRDDDHDRDGRGDRDDHDRDGHHDDHDRDDHGWGR